MRRQRAVDEQIFLDVVMWHLKFVEQGLEENEKLEKRYTKNKKNVKDWEKNKTN